MSNPYQHLTEEERIQRIAELLLLAVQRSCSAAPVADPRDATTAAPSEAVDPGSSADETDGKVLPAWYKIAPSDNGGKLPSTVRRGVVKR